MILLTSSQTLELVLGAAPATTEPVYTSGYVDEVTATMALGALGTSDGATNSTVAVTAVSSPSAGSVRRVTGLTVYNGDTVAVILTVRVNDSATTREVWKGLVMDGDTLFYTDLRGFLILNSSGEIRVAITNVGAAGSSGSSSVALHATTHESGGTDVIPLDTLGAPSDVTTLNASTTKHGLLPKLSGTAADNLKGDGTWSSTVAAANLTGTIASAVQDAITRLGTVTSGTWSATTIGVTKGGTGTATQFTAGSVVFAGASGVYSQDNATFFWDTTNKRLGIGTASPGVPLHVSGAGTGNADITATQTTGGAISRLILASDREWRLVSAGDTANDPFIIYDGTSSTTRLSIDSGGETVLTGNFKPATSQCFSWNAKSVDTAYQAASDGFFLGSASSTGTSTLTINSDSSNPPTTERARCRSDAPVGTQVVNFCIPVRKGDYYKAVSGGAAWTINDLWWVPVGTAG